MPLRSLASSCLRIDGAHAHRITGTRLMKPQIQERLNEILDRHSSFPLAAYQALNRGLDYTVRMRKSSGHVTGQELVFGMAGHLKTEYGPFARLVLDGWNIHGTLDFGRMVFNLIEVGLMRKQETDVIEDFLEVYDFDEVFSTDVDWLHEVRIELGLPSRKPGSLG